jgi:hypothetical protein
MYKYFKRVIAVVSLYVMLVLWAPVAVMLSAQHGFYSYYVGWTVGYYDLHANWWAQSNLLSGCPIKTMKYNLGVYWCNLNPKCTLG